MAKAKPAFKFQYVGTGPVTTGLVNITRDGNAMKNDGSLEPGDIVVVNDVDTAVWLRSLTNFLEVDSPTSDKPTHKPKKKAPK